MPNPSDLTRVILLVTILIVMPTVGWRTVDARPEGNSLTALIASSLTIVNASGRDIHSLYLSPSGSPSWGPDYLGRYILRPGDSKIVGDLTAGQYDILAVDADRRQCVMRNLPVNNPWSITEDCLAKNGRP